MKKTLLYIASPYTADEHDVMISRVEAVSEVTGKIIENFEHIIPFSPVAYTPQAHKVGRWICQLV